VSSTDHILAENQKAIDQICPKGTSQVTRPGHQQGRQDYGKERCVLCVYKRRF
jgi:hypothetical protein